MELICLAILAILFAASWGLLLACRALERKK